MRLAAAALIAFCAVTACVQSGPTATSPSSKSTTPSPSITTSPASSPSDTSSPGAEPFTTKLTCGRPVTATHGLALYEVQTTPPILEVLDVSNPLRPALLCLLSPAQGGSFDQAPNELVFWIGDQLGSADLSSGQVVLTARLPFPAFRGVYSRDGTLFAYRTVVDPAGSISTRLDGAGYDRELYLQASIGGHGGPPIGAGPFDQLEFSPDGKLLLDFYSFRPPTGPDNFLVYRTTGILGTYAPPDSFLIFHATTAINGAWAPTGGTLYFLQTTQDSSGEVDSVDATGRHAAPTRTVTGLFWPRVMPSGAGIVYDAYISPSGDNCGGVPKLFTFDLASAGASQLSPAISAEPVFITQTIVWSNEQKVGQCGPGGESGPDGVILAHDMGTGRDSVVDTTQTVPGIGGLPLAPPSTGQVLDVWY